MTQRQLAACVLLVAALTVSACASPSALDYIPEGPSYAADELTTALEESDAGAAAQVKVEDAADVRQDTLAQLREHGEEASALADMLTSEFPVDVAAVPYRVEVGTYEGQQAWIVYEAWGDEEGTLSYRRMWVLSYEDRAVIAAQSIR